MEYFKKWFNNNLKVGRYPTPQECKEMDYDVIINVSDEFIDGCMKLALEGSKRYYWFPLNECSSNMGLNSIYAALQILSNAEKENKKVFLHCHAGANRSPMIADCYYYMRTQNHRPEKEVSQPLKQELNIVFGKPKDYVSELDGMNCLQINSYGKHLPSIENMEEFIKECGIAFEKDETRRGGYLDSAKIKLKLD